MSAPPLIGVTTSEIRRKGSVTPTPRGEPAQTELALGLEYVAAVEASGAIPVVLPAIDPAAVGPLLDGLAGVCLSGGPDLEPASYGGGPHPQLGPTEPHVDRFELAAAGRAWELGMPVLAICRGTQALNVARGGSLIQHLPDEPGVKVEHRQQAPARRATHSVRIESGSALARLTGRQSLRVNSFHHQAVALIGDGLKVSARASDGVVEAVEAPGRPFVIGVQWHAEFLADRVGHGALFEGFVGAARRYGRARARSRAA